MFTWLYFLSLIYCISFHSLLFCCLISLIWMLVLLYLTHTNRRQTAEQQQFKRLTRLTGDKHLRFSDKQVQLGGRRRNRFFMSLCDETRCSARTRRVPLSREIRGSKANWDKELLTSAAGTRERHKNMRIDLEPVPARGTSARRLACTEQCFYFAFSRMSLASIQTSLWCFRAK